MSLKGLGRAHSRQVLDTNHPLPRFSFLILLIPTLLCPTLLCPTIPRPIPPLLSHRHHPALEPSFKDHGGWSDQETLEPQQRQMAKDDEVLAGQAQLEDNLEI